MGLSRGTSTDHDDLLTKLDEAMLGDQVATIAVNAPGTGYVVGDVLTIAGGTSTKAGRIIVTTIGGSGDITAARIWDSGAYSVDPTLAANAVTGGTGSSATFDLTMEASTWVKLKDDSTLDSSTERVVLWQNTATDVFIGARTYSKINGARTIKNWLCLGFSSYNAGLDWYQQPDLSPSGQDPSDGSILETTAGGSMMILKDNDTFAMDYLFLVSNRRVAVDAKLFDGVTTTPRYASCYMGLLNPFGTSAEIAYPLYVAGCTNHWQAAWDDLVPAFHFSGLSQCVGVTNRNGPGLYFDVDGVWKSVQNTGVTLGSSSRSEKNDYVIYPCGNTDVTAETDERIINDSTTAFQWENIIQMSGFTAADYELRPTPDSGGEKRILVPCVLLSSDVGTSVQIQGELDGIYWASAAGNTIITSEDTITDSGIVYRAFKNGVYNQLDGYLFMRES